jgi:hypothetical protein
MLTINMKFRIKFFNILFFAAVSISVPLYVVFASDQTSASFIVRDLSLGVGGGYETSTNFKLFGSGDLTGTGESSSSNFKSRLGFSYYPYLAKGILSAILNSSDADLTWTITNTALGFNVSAYEVGIDDTSGGPYAYTSVGTALNYTYPNLAPGDYFFVVRTIDGLNNRIATSNEATLTVPQVISFSVSDNSVGFNTVTSASPRFATGDSAGSASDTSAHNLQIQTNASAGYSISYSGTNLTGPEIITEATIVNDPDGSQNAKQFALSFSTDGGATISGSYDHDPTPANRDWKFTTSTSDIVVTQTSPTPLQTISAYYLANITASTSAGSYGGVITYIATANF